MRFAFALALLLAVLLAACASDSKVTAEGETGAWSLPFEADPAKEKTRRGD